MTPRNNRVSGDVEVRSPARSFTQALDNFYAPARDVRSERALQSGLNAFSSILGEQAAQLKREERSNEHIQGVQDALREEAGQELQGVKTGKLFRQHSKYYMMGLNETRGKAAATRFKQEMALAYQDWDGRHTDDTGQGFREWMNGRVAEFTNSLGDDQYKLAGALPILNEVTSNFATQHTAFTSSRLERESFEAYDEVISGTFDDLHSGKYDSEDGGTDWEKFLGDLKTEADDMYQTDGARANDHLVNAAIKYANIHNDPDAILALARAHDSGQIKISLSNREKLANAMDAVEADMERESSKQNAQTSAAAKARREAHLNAWASQLADNPYVELPDFDEVGDQQTYREMVKLQDAFIKGSTVENPTISNTERMQLEADLFGASTMQERIRLLSEFTQSNPTALSGADVSKYTKEIFATADPGSLINNQIVGKYREGFGNTLAEYQLGDGFDQNRSSFLRTQGERHFNDYMLSQAGNVDMQDPGAIRKAVKEAEEYAMEQLAFDFPEVLREKNEQSPLGKNLGVGEALANRDQAVAGAAAEEFSNMLEKEGEQNGAQPQQTPVDPETVPQPISSEAGEETGAAPLPPQAQPDLPIEEQPTPYKDPDDDTEYSPVRQGFYGELIHRFTDGKDDRPTLRSAQSVLSADTEFSEGVKRLAQKYDVSVTAILAVMDFETGGTFSPSVKNAADSGATGLIQFMPKTAKGLGTTTAALAKMTRGQQMIYVEKYFDQFGSRIRGGDVDDVYMSVLYPKAIGKPDGYVLFRKGTIAYKQNAGLDTNKDGTVTKFEAAAKVRQRFYRQ